MNQDRNSDPLPNSAAATDRDPAEAIEQALDHRRTIEPSCEQPKDSRKGKDYVVDQAKLDDYIKQNPDRSPSRDLRAAAEALAWSPSKLDPRGATGCNNLPTKCQTEPTKPPFGLLPAHLHDEQRVMDIFSAMYRYSDADKAIPVLWLTELQGLLYKAKEYRNG